MRNVHSERPQVDENSGASAVTGHHVSMLKGFASPNYQVVEHSSGLINKPRARRLQRPSHKQGSYSGPKHGASIVNENALRCSYL